MVLRLSSLCVWRGLMPALSTAAIHLALVPNTLMPSSSTRSHRRLPSGWKGEPSYSTTLAPTARLDTSQFHIIQPQVV